MKKLVHSLVVGLAFTVLQVTLVDAHQCSDNTPGSYYSTSDKKVWHECPVDAEEIFTKKGWFNKVDHLVPVGHQEGNEPFVCDKYKCRLRPPPRGIIFMDMGRVADEGRRTASPCSTCEEVRITKRRGAHCPGGWDPAGGSGWHEVRLGEDAWCACGISFVKWPFRTVGDCTMDNVIGCDNRRGSPCDATFQVWPATCLHWIDGVKKGQRICAD